MHLSEGTGNARLRLGKHHLCMLQLRVVAAALEATAGEATSFWAHVMHSVACVAALLHGTVAKHMPAVVLVV